MVVTMAMEVVKGFLDKEKEKNEGLSRKRIRWRKKA